MDRSGSPHCDLDCVADHEPNTYPYCSGFVDTLCEWYADGKSHPQVNLHENVYSDFHQYAVTNVYAQPDGVVHSHTIPDIQSSGHVDSDSNPVCHADPICDSDLDWDRNSYGLVDIEPDSDSVANAHSIANDHGQCDVDSLSHPHANGDREPNRNFHANSYAYADDHRNSHEYRSPRACDYVSRSHTGGRSSPEPGCHSGRRDAGIRAPRW